MKQQGSPRGLDFKTVKFLIMAAIVVFTLAMVTIFTQDIDAQKEEYEGFDFKMLNATQNK